MEFDLTGLIMAFERFNRIRFVKAVRLFSIKCAQSYVPIRLSTFYASKIHLVTTENGLHGGSIICYPGRSDKSTLGLFVTVSSSRISLLILLLSN